jgi:hypothetical protein
MLSLLHAALANLSSVVAPSVRTVLPIVFKDAYPRRVWFLLDCMKLPLNRKPVLRPQAKPLATLCRMNPALQRTSQPAAPQIGRPLRTRAHGLQLLPHRCTVVQLEDRSKVRNGTPADDNATLQRWVTVTKCLQAAC